MDFVKNAYNDAYETESAYSSANDCGIRLTDVCDAAAAIAARLGGVLGVGDGVLVRLPVDDGNCVGVGVVDAVEDGVVKDVGEGVGVWDGVMDADAPKESDGVGVEEGVVDGVGVCEGATAILKEVDESV
jgi:hypothetical protein